jgi:ankyrin repeat protein
MYKTLAYVAAEHGSWRVLNFLMNQIDQQKLTLDKHYQERHLFYSVLERGDIEGVRLFVEKLNDPTLLQEPLDDLGTHAVHLAAKSGSKEILDYLYNQGANFAVKDKKQQDSLFYAIQSENSEIVASLLDKKYQLPILAESIFAAAALEKDKIFLLLLKSGANLNHPSLTQQKTPLMLAIQHKNLQAFLRILEQKNVLLTTPSPTQPSPLLLASQEGEATMLSMLLLRLPQATKEKFKGNNALHLACENGHPACITLLLESGFSIHELNDRKVSPELLANKRLSSMAALGIEPYKKEYGQWLNLILTAIQSKNIQKILDLVQKCPINTYFSTSIFGESYSGTLLHFLIKYCKSFPNTNELITQICSREGFKSNLKDKDGLSYAHLMINNKIDPTNWKVLSLEEKDNLGRTPLHLAITSKSLILLKGLIEKLGKSKLDPLDHLGLTPLIYAIQLNKKKFAKYLIRNGANLHLKNNQGITPLIFASAKGNYLMVRLLVKYGASINEIQKGSTITPLFAALEANQEEISLFLLYQGANARHLFEQNRLISHLAAEKGKNSILRLLAAKGQALLNSDENGLQPIHYAAKAGQIKTLSFLESLGISIESQTFPKSTSSLGVQTPLNFAASQGTVEAVKWLLEHQANPEKPTESSMDILASSLMNHSKNSEKLLLLFKDYLISNNLKYVLPATVAAIVRDYIEPLKVLYQMGVPIHTELYQGLTSLHYACKYGALQCTEFLLEQNVNLKCLSSSGQTPLEFAAANSSVEQFRLMLDQVDCDIDKRYQGGETLLHIAVRAGNLAHVALIIDAEADLNIQDVQGQTPLFIAAQKNLEEIVNLLLLCGADSSIKTIFNSHLPEQIGSEKIKNIIQARQKIYQQIPENQTYLHLAAQTNNLLAVQLNARNFYINVNQQNSLGRTALHEAALHGQLANIRELLSKGASIDIQDTQGITPLGLTCLTNHHLPAFKFLLQAGANPKIPNKNGQVLTQIFQDDLTKYPFLELLTNQLV